MWISVQASAAIERIPSVAAEVSRSLTREANQWELKTADGQPGAIRRM